MDIDPTDAEGRADVGEPSAPRLNGDARQRGGAVGKRNLEIARSLWTELLARLTHVADELALPETAMKMRGIGVRSMEGALTNIAREFARANQIALATGAAPRPHDIMNRAKAMGVMHDLRFDYLELARAYRLLTAELDLPCTCHRFRWLEGRAQLHQNQANELERSR